MGRSKIREHIFKLLFMSQFNTEEEMPQQLTIYFNELEELDESDRAYMQEKYEQVISHLQEIDELLNQLSKGWKIPTKVSINEAVELAKRFGGEDSFAFVNGILGRAAKELR